MLLCSVYILDIKELYKFGKDDWQLEIRKAQFGDLPQIVDIYNQSVISSTATFDLKEATLEQRTEWFLQHYGNYPLIVATVAGKVVGYSSLSCFREKEAYAHTVESSVYIDGAHHGKGIGKALMEEILCLGAKIGHHVVIAGITSGNETSIKLHESLGFVYIGCFKEVGFKFGEWQDVFFYQKFL